MPCATACGTPPASGRISGSERPDVLLHLHVEGTAALVSVDFSGESLHRRGYRMDGGRAPLKENVAAAVLLRAGWPAVNAAGGLLVDPLCGSGTFSHRGGNDRGRRGPCAQSRVLRIQRGGGATIARAVGPDAARRSSRARRSVAKPRAAVIPGLLTSIPMRCEWSIENAAHAGVADWIHVEKAGARRSRAAEQRRRLGGDQSALWRTHRSGIRIVGIVFRAGANVARAVQGLAGRGSSPAIRRWRGISAFTAKRTHRVYNGTIECRCCDST